MNNEPIITSMLDTDQYKISMGQAILFGRSNSICFQDVDVVYEFINRGNIRFPKGFTESLQEQLAHLQNLQLTDHEYRWLQQNCPYLKRAYLDFLRGFRFRDGQIQVEQKDGDLKLRITGPWYETVYYEVMVMAIISELYYRMQGLSHVGVYEKTSEKAKAIRKSGISIADFGTRRRFSHDVHDQVVSILASEAGPTFVGTSNVHLAMKYGIKPIGTHAHEFFMAHAALFGCQLANHLSLQTWADEYKGDLGIALSDTFTTDVFLRDFDKTFAKMFDGTRHDSGPCIPFAEKMIAHYKKLGIDPMSKTIVFSDGLNIEKAIKINKWCKGRIKCSFGIGTHLTNDCGHMPLNMVVKMTECNDIPTVKLSDIEEKNTGDPRTVELYKQILEIA